MIEIFPYPIAERPSNSWINWGMLKNLGTAMMAAAALLLNVQDSAAQTPQSINYQAVARHAITGRELPNQEIYLIAKIRLGGQSGAIVYQEEHDNLRTDAFGLFTFQIGNGEPMVGNFSTINWGMDKTWLELDIDAGEGLESVGSIQFVSVPYALHAETVRDKDDADADPQNELISNVNLSSDGSTLLITEAGITHSVSLPAGSGGGNNSDELITEFALAGDGSTIVLTEAGVTRTVQLPADIYIDDDADPQNELITNFEFNPQTAIASIVERDNTWEIDLSSLVGGEPDGDSSPTNELVTNFLVVGGNLRLTQSGLGNEFNVPLSTLNLPDGDTDPNNEKITNWTTTANGYTFNESSLPYTIDVRDGDSDDENELVTSLTVTGGNLVVNQNGTPATIPLSTINLPDGDTDPNNEKITNWTTTANGYTFNESSLPYTIDVRDGDSDDENELVTSLTVTGGNLVVNQNGTPASIPLSAINLPDGDTSPTNELQTLSQVLTHNAPLGSNAGGNKITNLGDPTLAQDAATKKYVDDQIHIGDANGTYNALKVTGIQGRDVADTAPADGMVLKYNAAQSRWEPAVDAVGIVPAVIGFVSVSPMDFIGIREDNPGNNYNVAVHEDDTRFVTILKRNEGDKIGAPIHFPHGVIVDNLKVSFKVRRIGSRTLNISVERHNIAAGTVDLLYSQTFQANVTNDDLRTETIDGAALPIAVRTINNELYSYRIIARFVTVDNHEDAANSFMQFHGAVFRYSQ